MTLNIKIDINEQSCKVTYAVVLMPPNGSTIPLENYAPKSVSGLLCVVEALVKGQDPPKDYIAIRDKDSCNF